MRKFISLVSAFLVGIATTGIIAASTTAGATLSEPIPHCQPVQIDTGLHIYNGQACNTHADSWIKMPPVGKEWQLAFSGGVANGFALFAFQTPKPASSTTMMLLGSTSLPGCFGHNGVAISGFISYECVFQPSGLGGALYWSANEANFNWDKHPGSGLDWLEASTIHKTSDSNPVNNKHDFWVGIANSSGNFCSVINPGYNQEPTMCAFPGQLAHMMSAKQQATYDQFEATMESANIPDCAWSMTIDSAQCDVDQAP